WTARNCYRGGNSWEPPSFDAWFRRGGLGAVEISGIATMVALKAAAGGVGPEGGQHVGELHVQHAQRHAAALPSPATNRRRRIGHASSRFLTHCGLAPRKDATAQERAGSQNAAHELAMASCVTF